jgi:hypothetical protein
MGRRGYAPPMAFQVQPEPVGRRGARASVVLVGVVGLAIVAFALLTGTGHDLAVRPIVDALPSPVPATAMASPSVSPTERPTDDRLALDGSSARFRGPVTIVCNDAGVALCARIVAAASSSVLGRSSIREIQVWTALLCRDSSDCPASRIVGTFHLGSAVVSFRSGLPDAWVNVVGPLPVQPRSSLDDIAWIIN